MADPTPTTRGDLPGRVWMPSGVGVYERPRTAWLREHLGLLLPLAGLAVRAIREWACALVLANLGERSPPRGVAGHRRIIHRSA